MDLDPVSAPALPMPWYAEGLRWLGELCLRAAERMRREAAPARVEIHVGGAEERLRDMRHRIHCGY